MTLTDEPTIVSATLAAGHDGLAEVAIAICYPNGAEREMMFAYETIASALDVAGITDLSQLVGQAWTMLLAPAAILQNY